MSRKKTQAYTEEFRREAVRRADQPGNTAASVARELGVHPGQIYNWRRQFTRLSDKQFNSVDGVDYSKAESEAIRKLRRENETLKKENEFLKKGVCVLREVPRVKYALISEFCQQYTVRLMCRVMEVSASGYYRWKQRPVSLREQRRKATEAAIMDTYASFKACYGAPRIARELTAAGVPCSVNYVASIMQEKEIRARNGKAFKYSRTSEAMTNVVDNLLWRQFAAERPNQKWTTDITYIWVKDRWLYLATVMDLYSRQIVGWSLDMSMTERLITDALSMAYGRREVPPGLIVHSDRGVQYRSTGYQDYLRSRQCVPSMSRKGNCWDNAPMESFFSRLKVELIYAELFESIAAAKSAIFEYIEVFYNRKRRHSALGYLSPVEYERRSA